MTMSGSGRYFDALIVCFDLLVDVCGDRVMRNIKIVCYNLKNKKKQLAVRQNKEYFLLLMTAWFANTIKLHWVAASACNASTTRSARCRWCFDHLKDSSITMICGYRQDTYIIIVNCSHLIRYKISSYKN